MIVFHDGLCASDLYSETAGCGFEPGYKMIGVDRETGDALRRDFITAEESFLFSARLPEGNYRVKVVLGDAQGQSAATVKAELRRLMVEKAITEQGRFQTVSFIVNIRTPRIDASRSVRLKNREKAQRWSRGTTDRPLNLMVPVRAFALSR